MLSDRDRRDIQGLVLFGTTCPLLRYHFFQASEPVAGRRFVRTLIEPGGSLRVNTAGHRDTDTRSEHLLYVAFTWKGLEALGVPSPTLLSFPPEFRDGANVRAATLGDVGESDPATWLLDPDAVHIVVMVYARHRHTLESVSTELVARAAQHAWPVVQTLDAAALPDFTHESGQRVTRPVHFGYSDSISQPDI